MPEETMENPAAPAKEKVTVITSAVAKEKYPVRKGFKTANGGTVRDSGDAVAVALRGKDIDYWLKLAEANGRGEDLQKTADAHPNNLGMVRMALGTILRAAIKRHNEATDKSKEPYPILSLGGDGEPAPGTGTPPVTETVPGTTPEEEDEEDVEDEDDSEEDEEDK